MMNDVVINEVSLNISKFINEILPSKLDLGIEMACQKVENKAKDKCPVDDGPLKASIEHKVIPYKGEGIVGTNEEYAVYVHEGTGIYAKNGNGRQTPWTYRTPDGKYHYTKGQEANPFLQDALDEEMPTLADCFKELI